MARTEVFKQLEKKFFEQQQRSHGESVDHISTEVEARYEILYQLHFITLCSLYHVMSSCKTLQYFSIPCTLPCVCCYHSDSDSGGGHSWLGVTPNISCNMTKVQTHDYGWLDHSLQ